MEQRWEPLKVVPMEPRWEPLKASQTAQLTGPPMEPHSELPKA
jgi:hypothetical protein